MYRQTVEIKPQYLLLWKIPCLKKGLLTVGHWLLTRNDKLAESVKYRLHENAYKRFCWTYFSVNRCLSEMRRLLAQLLLNLSQFLALDSISSFTAVCHPSQWCNTATICSGVPRLCQNSIRLISVLDSIDFDQRDRNVYIQHSMWTFGIYLIKACSQQKHQLIVVHTFHFCNFKDLLCSFFSVWSWNNN